MPRYLPPPTANTLLKRLLEATMLARDEFAKTAEMVSSPALTHLLIERALDLTHIADELRQELAQQRRARDVSTFTAVGNRQRAMPIQSLQHPRRTHTPAVAIDRPVLQLVRSGK